MSTDIPQGVPQGVPQLLTLKEFCGVKRLSPATIHRLKNAGKLTFYQPSGKGGKLLFPVNAIELAASAASAPSVPSEPRAAGSQRLSGPAPKWLSGPRRST